MKQILAKQVLCMNWGGVYGPEYVNRLYSMVRRHLTAPFRFVCYTDDQTGIRPEIECFECPEVDIPSKKRNRGWRKLSLWNSELPGLTGTVLFLDLDIVITGSLNDFFDYQKAAPFCVIHNWTQPDRRIGNTSVYRFEVGMRPSILTEFLKDYESVLRSYPNSQTYISECLSEQLQFWPTDWCCSFKRHCVPSGIQRWFRQARLPDQARIVAFPGHPNPHEALAGIWPAPWYKRLYKYIQPVSWIREHWR